MIMELLLRLQRIHKKKSNNSNEKFRRADFFAILLFSSLVYDCCEKLK